MRTYWRDCGVVLFAAALLAWGVAPAAAGDYEQLLEDKPSAVVTAKFLLNVKMGGTMGSSMGGDQEVETEAPCVLIGPKGLVLCSSTHLGGMANLLQRFMGMGSQLEISATPTEIKILLGNEPDGPAARLLARDTDLDLAWLQIEDPGERTFPFIDFAKGAKAEAGEPFVAVRRMDRFFGRAPTLIEGRIGGSVQRPRPLLVPATNLGPHLGLPVFTLSGQVLGFTVLQLPDDEGGGQSGSALSMMERSTRFQQLLTGLILPAEEVVRATQLALEMTAADSQ